MVSLRCKMIVKEKLKKLGFTLCDRGFGNAEFLENITLIKQAQLKENLLRSGLELLDDKKVF